MINKWTNVINFNFVMYSLISDFQIVIAIVFESHSYCSIAKPSCVKMLEYKVEWSRILNNPSFSNFEAPLKYLDYRIFSAHIT